MPFVLNLALCACLCLGVLTMSPSALASPPVAERHPQSFLLHGDTRIDPYFWLREEGTSRVLDYLEAENAYTDAYMADTVSLQQQLYHELTSYLIEEDQTVPRQRGGYWYYSRIGKGQNYRVYCRRKGHMQAPEEVLLDLNVLAKGESYLNLAEFEVSPDQRYLAYSIDTSGAESYILRIKNLQTGELLPDTITGTYYSLEWANDSKTLFYTLIDDANRPYKLMRHRLGTSVSADITVHHETDERFNVSVYKTSSERFLIRHLESNTTTEQAYIPADQPEALPVLIQAREQGLEYMAQDQGSVFLIHTNDGATNFKLVQTPLHQTSKRYWQTLVSEREEAKLESVHVFADWISLVFRGDARLMVEAREAKSGTQREIKFPDSVASIWPSSEQDYHSNQLRVSYSSLVTPISVFDANLVSGELTLRKQDKIPGYVMQDYVMKREYATASDGTKVPLTLVHHKDLKLDGQNPTYLYSYGSYGISTDPDFYPSVISLLKRGFVYAIAHIRGGEEMGRRWYENGKLLHKRNTFTDFISVADHLVARGYTQPKQLSIEGGSAGGLLMGAVTNLRPDLFHSVIADVPFVDALNTMLDPSLPLTVIEYEEWGNPNEKVYYDYIKSYSPYDNVIPQDYPHMLVLAGLHDPRVKYWEPAKWVAKMRTLKTDQNTLLLKTNMTAGHSGASGRYDALKESAFKFAFLLKTLGWSAVETSP